MNNNQQALKETEPIMTKQGLIGSPEWITGMQSIIDQVRPLKEEDIEMIYRGRKSRERRQELLEWLDTIGTGLFFMLMFAALYLFMASIN